METLKDVVTTRINQRIAHGRQHAQQAIKRISDEAGMAEDYIVSIGRGRVDTPVGFNASDTALNMVLYRDNEMALKTLHDNAIGQLAGRLSIPAPYLKELCKRGPEQKDLAARILSDHKEWSSKQRMLVRAVGGEVRGVLSDQFRRLNSLPLVESFLTESAKQGAEVVDGHFTDTKLFIETLVPEPIIFDTPRNGEVAIAFGARMSNSDYGDGALELRFFFMQGICLNGMVRESVMRQVHLGRRLPADLALSQRTYQLDTQTMSSAIKDITEGLFSLENIKQKMQEIQNASATLIDLPRELSALQKGGRLAKDEMKGIEAMLLKADPNDGIQGESSIWKLVQGVSAYGREAKPDRQRELHEIAGQLIERAKN